MFRSFVIPVAMLIVSTTVVAEESSLWSAPLTADEIQLSSEATAVGYFDLTPISGTSPIQKGDLSDLDFDVRGTTHSVVILIQNTSAPRVGTLDLAIGPAMDEQDLESLTFRADGQPLTVDGYSYLGAESYPTASIVLFRDPADAGPEAESS